MKKVDWSFDEMVAMVPPEIALEADMEFAIPNRIVELMEKRRLTKVGLANAQGKRPSEVTKWISGQHNFTIRTLAMLSTFFGESLMVVK